MIHPLLVPKPFKPEKKAHKDFVKFSKNKHKVLPQERSRRTEYRLGTSCVCREGGQYMFPPIYI